MQTMKLESRITMQKIYFVRVLPFFFMVLLLSACGGEEPVIDTHVWIDAPADGVSIHIGQEIHIEGHASGSDAITNVEVWIGGDLYQTLEDLGTTGALTPFMTAWTPPAVGDYIVEVIAFGTEGATSSHDSAMVHVIPDVTPTASSTPTPVVTSTPTETPTPVPTVTATMTSCVPSVVAEENVNCRQGPGLFYEVLGVLMESELALAEGRNEDSTWWWIFNPDGAGHCWVSDASVMAYCGVESLPVIAAPPTPTYTPTAVPEDNTAPPAPSQVSPIGGPTLPCASQAILDWNAVTDPSGIDEYRVQVEQEITIDNWQSIPGSPFTNLSATELSIPVDCGIKYRWRVRAVDNAGNLGPFSAWALFGINLP
jgi:hypothetical protein